MNVTQENLRERLQWVNRAREGILSACGEEVVGSTFQIFNTVDPLCHILKITLVRPLAKATRQHLRDYIRAVADVEGNCEIPRIRIEDRFVQAEVLIKHRQWSKDGQRTKQGPQRFVRSRPG